MRKKIVRRNIKIAASVILSIIVIERAYNSRAVFQTKAENTSNYGIIDARFSNKEKLKDFEYIYQTLEEQYAFFEVNKRQDKMDWLDNKARYKRIIRNTDNDTEFIAAINNILKELNDDNTYILTGDMYRRYYKHYYPERREIFHYERSLARYDFDWTFDLDPSNDFIFHNGPVLDTEVLVENELAYMKLKAMSHYHVEEDYPKIKSFLEEVKDFDKLIIDIRGNSGGFDDYWMNIVKLLINDVHSAEYYSFFKNTARTIHDPFKVPGIASVRDLDEKILEQFPPEVKADFKYYKANSIEIIPEESVGFKGKVYLLVDEEVSSAAEKFAAFAKDTGFATLIGETTGGGMNFADIPMDNAPYGGYIFTYSRELVFNSDATINKETKTTPHIAVEHPSPNEDHLKDSCIQAVMEDN
ncbi:S41 family peptidase [Tissierella sp.]|uniref:S41 family peptidase n=1 Tax=Tissierella sp. TaxID=41274 RepID=UPI002865099E|nr:S41 family peptidase [Tissierella sp.]MDR7855051.1 S41 family peptidase [Tissierella sp.]